MDQEVAGSILVVPTRAWGTGRFPHVTLSRFQKEVLMGAEAIVRIRFWESQEDCHDEYYAVPEDQLEEIQRLVRRDPGNAAARTLVEERGRKLEPQATVEVDEY